MRRSCLDCEYFDKEHYDMYEEAICTADYQSTLSTLRQEIEQAHFNLQTAVAHIMLQDNLSTPSGTYLSGTYLYGGWMPVPQVCCTGGPEKTNCKNCGAPLRGHYCCEYCGTVNN